VHPDDLPWNNEVSFWTSSRRFDDRHMATSYKHAKTWAVQSGAIMENIITLPGRDCCEPVRHAISSRIKLYDLNREQAVLATLSEMAALIFRAWRLSRLALRC
jgi:hypothetical protein